MQNLSSRITVYREPRDLKRGGDNAGADRNFKIIKSKNGRTKIMATKTKQVKQPTASNRKSKDIHNAGNARNIRRVDSSVKGFIHDLI
jgi:hypothetical protein